MGILREFQVDRVLYFNFGGKYGRIVGMDAIVLSLCDYTGNMVRPWARAGYKCICVDTRHKKNKKKLVHKSGGQIEFISADIAWWLPPRAEYKIVFAFPPCTHLAVSGARWFQEKGLRGLIEGLELIERCRAICVWSKAPWMLENPVGTISTYWRKPDYIFNPCEYARYLEDPSDDAYTKKTCLWTGNRFVMPEVCAVEPVKGSKMHLIAPSEHRSHDRSVTPRGFANAVFEANSK